jgi:hypothetical protein
MEKQNALQNAERKNETIFSEILKQETIGFILVF